MIYLAGDYTPTFSTEYIKSTSKRRPPLLRSFAVLDTETSHNHDEENPKCWIYQFSIKIDNDIICGRTPSEIIDTLNTFIKYAELSKNKKLVIYIHNASYDLAYIKQFIIEAFGNYEILAIAPHKFITFSTDYFIIRCSYKLANRSLEKWGKDLNIPHQKKVGLIDYDCIVYQDDLLTPEHWLYMIYDVISLEECLKTEMSFDGYNVQTIPLTSTGYVRNTARKYFKEKGKNRKSFLNTRLTEETYRLCRNEFAGGLTHGNRHLAGKLINKECLINHGYPQNAEIKHRDFRSHYPSQLRKKKQPTGKINLYSTQNNTIEKVFDLVNKGYNVLVDITISNAELQRKEISMPILQESKVRAYKVGNEKLSLICDNGRVLKMKSGACRLCFTEYDLDIFASQYIFDYEMHAIYTIVSRDLPEYLKKTVDYYMLGKTEKKYLAKTETDRDKKIEYEIDLLKKKNGLNGIYGMCATDPVRVSYTMDENGVWGVDKETDIESELNKYYKSYNNFMRYIFGIYCTSEARHELIKMCELVGYNNVIYGDTDSLFYISTPEIEIKIEEYNERMRNEAIKQGAYIEYNGDIVNYDAFELENEIITDFKFLHSKCYAYNFVSRETSEKELKCVIAGVTPFEDATRKFSREDELGNIDNLKAGFVFTRCGGTKALYIEDKPRTEYINGHLIELAGGCIITKTTKTLNDEITRYEDFEETEII